MLKFVQIKWRDAASLGGWRGKKAVKHFITKILSAGETGGYLLYEGKDKVVVCQTVFDNQVIGLFEIPRGCVMSMKTIFETDVKFKWKK